MPSFQCTDPEDKILIGEKSKRNNVRDSNSPNKRTADLLDQVYKCLETGQSLDSIHIPHSSVFYVRAALQHQFPDREFTLEEVEELMREELDYNYE
jgi:hypothetical protein